MSMPIANFTCDRCDFGATNSIHWGRFYYELTEGSLVHLERGVGWCFTCKSIVPIEELDQIRAMDNLKGLKGELNQKQEQLARIQFRKRGILARWFVPDKKLERLQQAVDYLHEQISEALLYVNILSSRKSPPRCLICVHDKVIPFEVPLYPEEGAGKRLTGFVHPGCGGNIMAEMPKIRIAMRIRTRIYSPEAVFLREEYEPEPPREIPQWLKKRLKV